MAAAPRVECDVLVIGGGMAGATAALAAREAGARVALVRRSPGGTGLSGGALSVASDPVALPDAPFAARAGVVESAHRIAALRPGHPYAVLRDRLDRLWNAVEFATGQLSGVLSPPTGRNRWLLTPYGHAHAAAACQPSMVGGDLATVRGRLAVVGARGHLGWDPGLVAEGARRVRHLGGPEAVAVAADLFLWEEAALARPFDLARMLEQPGAAEEAGRAIRRVLPAGAAAAVLPPVLGLDPGAAVQERMAAAAGLPVAEMLSDLPSVPGLRLHRAIEARLAAAGVEVIHGDTRGGDGRVAEGPAAGSEPRNGRLARIGPGLPLGVGTRVVEAGRWVLATGRFVGGGVARLGLLVESVLGLPVQASEGSFLDAGPRLAQAPPATLTARDGRAPQPLLSAGLRVDARLRPLDGDGRVADERLFAAGALVGGHDPASDGTGMGVAILTGWLAGRSAAGKGDP